MFVSSPFYNRLLLKGIDGSIDCCCFLHSVYRRDNGKHNLILSSKGLKGLEIIFIENPTGFVLWLVYGSLIHSFLHSVYRRDNGKHNLIPSMFITK